MRTGRHSQALLNAIVFLLVFLFMQMTQAVLVKIDWRKLLTLTGRVVTVAVVMSAVVTPSFELDLSPKRLFCMCMGMGMGMGMYVCVHVYVCVCAFWIEVCMLIYKRHSPTCIHALIHAHTHASAQRIVMDIPNTYRDMHTCTHSHAQQNNRTHTHGYTHAHGLNQIDNNF